jgi:threonine synthase
MKYIIILGDGMADEPVESLGNRTPLQAADTPAMDLLARQGRSGLLHTIPEGMSPGSEVANLAVLGYDVPNVLEGRGSLEAASMGIEIGADEMALRCNLITIENGKIKNHSAGHISSEEAAILIRYLNENLAAEKIHFYPGVSYRHLLKIKDGNKHLICTAPHDVPGMEFTQALVRSESPEAQSTAGLLNNLILRSQELLENHPVNLNRKAAGKDPANSIWPWSPGYKPQMKPLSEIYAIRSGAVISAVDLIKGIGVYAGLENIDVPGATGLYDTNYEGKAQAALKALKEKDFVYLHVEASDEAGHEGDAALKVKTIEYLDSRILKPIMEETKKWKEPVALALLPDHPTPCRLKTHTAAPVPFVICRPGDTPDEVTRFDEFSAKQGVCGILKGAEFMNHLMYGTQGTESDVPLSNRRSKPFSYYSTNKQAPKVDLQEAVIRGLAPDRGLYMPESIRVLPDSFYGSIADMSFHEIAFEVARAFFGNDVDTETLRNIVIDTLNFDTPVVKISDTIHSLELFHGPTLAFKDVGARFMARLLRYFIEKQGLDDVNVLVATSGDTGSAVANGFLGVAKIHVYVLYPKGKVSAIQECQFATLGQNITALEIDGTFDDCQALVKSAFMDRELNEKMKLTSANSINVARFLPQAFYYFHAFAQLKRLGIENDIVFSVPSGNFGNLTAGLIAQRMGLPVKRFIAANNKNDIFLQYLLTGLYNPRPSVQTTANAMDVGDPSNFARILDLYNHSHEAITQAISGFSCDDDLIRETVKTCYEETGYLLDPHGACGYSALRNGLQPNETGVFLETAHPAKFKETIDSIIGKEIEIPEKLQAFMKGKKQSIELSTDFRNFKDFIGRN